MAFNLLLISLLTVLCRLLWLYLPSFCISIQTNETKFCIFQFPSSRKIALCVVLLLLYILPVVNQKLDVPQESSLLIDGENHQESPSSALSMSSDANASIHRRTSSKWNDNLSQAGSTITETTQVGELISGSCCTSKLPIVRYTSALKF